MRRLTVLLLAALVAAGVGCNDEPAGYTIETEDEPDVGGETDGGDHQIPDPERDPDTGRIIEETPPVVITGVETLVRETEVAAGTAIYVNCQTLGEDGEPVLPDEPVEKLLQTAPAESFGTPDSEDELVVLPTRTGAVTITCALPELGLIDPTPAEVIVTEGRPHTVVTSVSPSVITAGEQVTATCDVFDAYDNPIEEPRVTLRVTPESSGIRIGGLTALVERAGLFEATCEVRGATNTFSDTFETLPGPPSTLAIGVEPNQRVYQVGQVVEVVASVADRYNNVIARPNLSVTSTPDTGRFGQTRFRFPEEGTYDLLARINGPTDGGIELTATAQVVVNGTGPSIRCDEPVDGGILNMRPGNTLMFQGAVGDVHGVQSVRVNGRTIIPDQGRFETELTTEFGINFVDIVATDNLGASSTKTCAFLVADQWAPEGEFLDDAITLRLNQEAVDDENRADGLDSLNDMLHTVLNSQGLEDTLDTALRNANPLYPHQCVERFIICLTYLEVNYTGLDLRGPNDVTLTLVDGGLRAVAHVRNVRVGLRVGGTWNTSGTVSLERLTADMTFDLRLTNGRPQVRLRNVNSVSVGGVDTDFSGLVGFIVDIIVDLFEGRIRNLIRDLLRDYIRDTFNDVLDGAIGGLDITSLGTSFNVPKLDGSGDLELGFGIDFSTIEANPDRALFGIGARISGPVAHGGFTRGAPLPRGAVRSDPATLRPAAAAVSMGVLNQALHALWRGGFFDAAIGGEAIGADEGAGVELRTNLPPVVKNLGGGKVQLMLGAMRAEVVYPGIFDTPLTVSLGATADATVELAGDELRFGNIQIRELYFSSEDTPLTPQSRAVLESFLTRLVQSIVDDSLNDALPALPIPTFTLPPDLTQFGLPQNAALGLVDAQLSHSSTHVTLEAGFGVQQ